MVPTNYIRFVLLTALAAVGPVAVTLEPQPLQIFIMMRILARMFGIGLVWVRVAGQIVLVQPHMCLIVRMVSAPEKPILLVHPIVLPLFATSMDSAMREKIHQTALPIALRDASFRGEVQYLMDLPPGRSPILRLRYLADHHAPLQHQEHATTAHCREQAVLIHALSPLVPTVQLHGGLQF